MVAANPPPQNLIISRQPQKMLLKLTLAAVIFAAVAAQSDSELAAEIARLEAIQVSSVRGRLVPSLRGCPRSTISNININVLTWCSGSAGPACRKERGREPPDRD